MAADNLQRLTAVATIASGLYASERIERGYRAHRAATGRDGTTPVTFERFVAQAAVALLDELEEHTVQIEPDWSAVQTLTPGR